MGNLFSGNDEPGDTPLPDALIKILKDGKERGFKDDFLFIPSLYCFFIIRWRFEPYSQQKQSKINRGINDKMMSDLSEWIVKLDSKFKYLNLNYNDISSVGASSLFDALRESNSSIKRIHLYQNQLDDQCMVFLGEYLHENDNIERVGMGKCKITDKGIETLYPYLVGNKTLHELHLFDNIGITDSSYPYLEKIVKKSAITSINLDSTSVSLEKQRELKKLLDKPIEQRDIPARSTKSALPTISDTLVNPIAIAPNPDSTITIGLGISISLFVITFFVGFINVQNKRNSP